MTHLSHILVLADAELTAIALNAMSDEEARDQSAKMLVVYGVACGTLFRCDGPVAEPLTRIGNVGPRCE